MVTQAKTSKKKRKAATPTALPVVRPQVAGIDIGSTEHWVCGPGVANAAPPNVRMFGTTTDARHALADWLVAQHVESVAMESTSVYWIPVYERLEPLGKRDFSSIIWRRRLTSAPASSGCGAWAAWAASRPLLSTGRRSAIVAREG